MAEDEAKKLSAEGTRLRQEGKYEEALDSYDKALALDPKSAAAWYGRGLALTGLGRYQEVLESLDKALALDPKNASALIERGVALNSLGRHQEAVDSYDKALALDPNLAVAWILRGMTLTELGRYQEAVGSYDKALELEPGFAEAWTEKNEALDRLEEWLKQRRPPHPCVELFKLVAPVEQRLHLFIQQRLQQALGKSEAEWWVKGVPEKIRMDCATRWEQNLRRQTAYNYIFLIDLKIILDKNWRLFEPDFQRIKGQVKSKKEFLDGITRLNEIRNAVMHPVRSVPTEEEQAFARQMCQVIQDFTNTG